MAVTSVMGHVYSLDFPDQYATWYKIDPATLFTSEIIYKVNDVLNFVF